MLGRDRVDLGQQHWEQFLLGHGAVKLTFLENHALPATTRDADVGVARFGRTVHHAAHDRNRDRHLELRDVRLNRLHRRHHVVLQAAACRTGHKRRAFVAEG